MGSRDAQQKCRLEPINLSDEKTFQQLYEQRKGCVWDNQLWNIELWRDLYVKRVKTMFWIIPTEFPQLQAKGLSANVPVGHISLEAEASPPDLDLANPDKSTLMISTFYIIETYQGLGLGSAAVKALERVATAPPHGSANCHTIALATLTRKYNEDDGEEWRGLYAKRGMEPGKKGASNEDWYARMGYVAWKEQYKWDAELLDGTTVKLLAVYMRKRVR